MKLRLLIVTPGFYPARTYGGPVTSLYNLMLMLHEGIDFFVVTSNHELKDNTPLFGIKVGWTDMSFGRIQYLPDSDMTVRRFDALIKEVDPDCIYINAPYHRKTAPKLLYLAKKYKKRIVLATRGGLNPNAINYGRTKKEIYLRALSCLFSHKTILQSTSQDETASIKKRFHSIEVREIPNMPKPPVFDEIPEKSKKEQGTIHIIYVSRILPIKNLIFALKAIQRVKSRVVFDIYGPIESKEYWNTCQSFIEDEMPENIQVNYCGFLEKENLRDTYSRYDLFILPTESENFGHAIAEALYEKCPVLISNNTPWNDVNEFGVGRAISLDNIDGFTDYIELIANTTDDELKAIDNKIPDYLRSHFDYASLASQYINLFTDREKEKA